MAVTAAPTIAGLSPRPQSSEDLYRSIIHAWYTKKYLPAVEKQKHVYRGKSLNEDEPDLGPIAPEPPRVMAADSAPFFSPYSSTMTFAAT